MARTYPLKATEHRAYPPGFDGMVLVWDIDKTYLDTHFSRLGGLLRIPLEFAVDKGAIRGMPEVLRGLRRGAGERVACTPLYFVSASPTQLAGALAGKMRIDGVEYDGIVLKDWLAALARRSPWRLSEQVGFKLCALLTLRRARPRSREILFGDDSERDAVAFDLYRRLLSGALSPGEAVEVMTHQGVHRRDRRLIRDLLAALPTVPEPVERVYIHLASGTDPARYTEMGPHMRPVHDALELARSLEAHGQIGADTVKRVEARLKAG
jgi:hypothetical protein